MIIKSDNALLPPTIHLGYLPDAHVVALRHADFAKAAKKAKLYLDEMYEEYQAARARE
jgi:hypothetical protein